MAEHPRTLLNRWDVVVIDDEEDNLTVIKVILTEYGANVHTAADGEDGLGLIRSVRPKFVICDVSMPGLDGWSVIHEVKLDPSLKDIPVIALTAHAMAGDRQRVMAAGFDNYLTKPINVDTFIHDVMKAVS